MFPAGTANPIPNHSNFVDGSEANGYLILGCDAIALAAGLTHWNQRNETALPSLYYQEDQPEISWQTYREGVIGLRAACRLVLYNTERLKPDWEQPLPPPDADPPAPPGQAADPELRA